MADDYREALNDIFEAWGNDTKAEDVGEFCNNFIEDLKTKKEFKLYRYCPANYYALRNIAYQTIRLSPVDELNDIFEGLPISDDKELLKSDIEKFEKAASMTCFSEDKENWQMWGLYADSFKGICLEYDLKILDDTNGLLKRIYPVIYSDKRTKCDEFHKLCNDIKELYDCITHEEGDDNLNDYLRNEITSLFLHKSKAWKTEKEWRIIYSLSDYYDKYDVNFFNQIQPFDCLTGIYFGYRIEGTKRDDIIKIVKSLNAKKDFNRKIKIYDSILSKNEYSIDYSEINIE